MSAFTILIAEALVVLLGLTLVVSFWQLYIAIGNPADFVDELKPADRRPGVAVRTVGAITILSSSIVFFWLGFTTLSACGWGNYAVGPFASSNWYVPCAVIALGTIVVTCIDLTLAAWAAIRHQSRAPTTASWLLACGILGYVAGGIGSGLFAYLGASPASNAPLSTPAGLALVAATAIAAGLTVGVAAQAIRRHVEPMSAILAGTIVIVMAVVSPIPILIEGKSLRQDTLTLEAIVIVAHGEEISLGTTGHFTTDTAWAAAVGRANSPSADLDRLGGTTLSVPVAVAADAGESVCISAVSPSGRNIAVRQTAASNARITGIRIAPPDEPAFDCRSGSLNAWREAPSRALKDARQEQGAGSITHC